MKKIFLLLILIIPNIVSAKKPNSFCNDYLRNADPFLSQIVSVNENGQVTLNSNAQNLIKLEEIQGVLTVQYRGEETNLRVKDQPKAIITKDSSGKISRVSFAGNYPFEASFEVKNGVCLPTEVYSLSKGKKENVSYSLDFCLGYKELADRYKGLKRKMDECTSFMKDFAVLVEKQSSKYQKSGVSFFGLSVGTQKELLNIVDIPDLVTMVEKCPKLPEQLAKALMAETQTTAPFAPAAPVDAQKKNSNKAL